MADNLELQGGVYHVRLSIPKDVQKEFGDRKILSQSLKTGLRSEAMTRRLPFLCQWKADIYAAREQKIAAREQWRPELAERSIILDRTIDFRLLEAVKNPPKGKGGTMVEIMARVEQLERDREAFLQEAQALEDAGAKGLVERLKNRFEQEPTTMLDSVQAGAAIGRDVMIQLADRRYSLTPTEINEATAIVHTPATYKPKSPITKARLAAFRTFRERMNVSAKNVDQQESKLSKLSAFLTETGKPLDFDCVTGWLDSLKTSSKTKQQYLNAGNTFWKWAMKYDARWREDNKGTITPFERHDLPQLKGKDKADAQRLAFELNELSKLHAAAHKKGVHVLADLILLGTYTGARIEELCQLRTEHIIVVEGVQSFNIDDSKTAAGIRVVPVHPALTTLVQRLITDTKDGYLVPSESKNKYGNRSDLLSKAFGRLKTSQGFGPLQVFHSIRKTAITRLVRASVTGTLIAELVGHETGTVTYDVYSQGASAAQKLEAISKLPILPA
jgi:integrase